MLKSIITTILAAGFAHAAVADDMPMAGKSASLSAAEKRMIRDAMSAAPKKVGEDATIVVMDDKGAMRTLREGTNGFTCLPDNTTTPGRDPMCMDAAALDWANAWIGHTQPVSGKVGFMYMLAGGSDASNTDPYATKPAPGNHWVRTGAHVMVVGADPDFYDMYPKSHDPDTSVPYVMWPGTPYQHLMIPVK